MEQSEQGLSLVEKNTLIAKFMGAKVIHDYPHSQLMEFDHNEIYPNNNKYHSNTVLKYHSSWEWLIPVVHKIWDTQSYSGPTKVTAAIQHHMIYGGVEQCFNAVADLINWYKEL